MKSLIYLKSISNNTKLRLINILLEDELCVCELEEILEVRQVNISKNLIHLKASGLVDVRREKQRGFYYLTEEFLSQKLFLEYIASLKEHEQTLRDDYIKYKDHLKTRDTKTYACKAYRNEGK